MSDGDLANHWPATDADAQGVAEWQQAMSVRRALDSAAVGMALVQANLRAGWVMYLLEFLRGVIPEDEFAAMAVQVRDSISHRLEVAQW